MMYYLLVYITCPVLLISSVFGVDTPPQIANKTLNTTQAKPEYNIANLTLVSEGGTVLTNDPNLTLSKENITSLIDLDAELGKTKEKSVVKPRKGVDNLLFDNKTVEKNTPPPVLGLDKSITDKPVAQNLTKPVVHAENTTKILNNKTSTEKPKKQTETHKKPLILSYESLASADTKAQGPVNPTSKALDNNQIPSPHENSFVKLYKAKPNSHPGMIMPIVITILVVPMFAIVGYMALRRGQEAWKNRHYKRMDFLLDGMYND